MTTHGPLPSVDLAAAETLFEPSETGEGHWVGAPCVHRHGGTTYLALRRRSPAARGHTLEVYERSGADEFDRVFRVGADDLGVVSLERPAMATDPVDGSLHLYLPVERGENDWAIHKLDGAEAPEEFDPASASPVLLPADGTTDRVTVKDPYVLTVGRRYYMFYAGHDGRSEQAHLATSTDGEDWRRSGSNPVLGRAGWHDHHTRVSCVVPARDASAWHVFYDGSGRDDYGRTWNLRTGTALSFDLETVVDTSPAGPWLESPAPAVRSADRGFATARYLDVLDHGDAWEVFLEVARPDGAFDLRRTTVQVPGDRPGDGR